MAIDLEALLRDFAEAQRLLAESRDMMVRCAETIEEQKRALAILQEQRDDARRCADGWKAGFDAGEKLIKQLVRAFGAEGAEADIPLEIIVWAEEQADRYELQFVAEKGAFPRAVVKLVRRVEN